MNPVEAGETRLLDSVSVLPHRRGPELTIDRFMDAAATRGRRPPTPARHAHSVDHDGSRQDLDPPGRIDWTGPHRPVPGGSNIHHRGAASEGRELHRERPDELEMVELRLPGNQAGGPPWEPNSNRAVRAVLHADAQRNRHALACECGPLGPTRRRGRGHPQHVDDTMVTRRRSISSGSRTHSPSSGPQSAPATTSDSRRSPITPPSPWDPPPAGSPLPGRDRDRPRPTPPPRRPHGRWGHGTP